MVPPSLSFSEYHTQPQIWHYQQSMELDPFKFAENLKERESWQFIFFILHVQNCQFMVSVTIRAALISSAITFILTISLWGANYWMNDLPQQRLKQQELQQQQQQMQQQQQLLLQQQREIALLQGEVAAKQLRFEVNLLNPNGWTTLNGTSCAKVDRLTFFDINITNTSAGPVRITSLKFQVFNSTSTYVTPSYPPEESDWALEAGQTLETYYTWSDSFALFHDQMATFSITIVSLEFQPQTALYCVYVASS